MKSKTDLAELLSYDPSPELVRMILADVQTTGKCIEECADKYALPPMFIPDDNGRFEHNGETFTAETFEKRYPHRKFITIKSR